MQKFVWVSPSKERIASMVRVSAAVAKFRRENPEWARMVIEKYYRRRR